MWDIHQDPVNMMLMHHRYPTSTDNRMEQTHPMDIEDGSLKFKYLVVHNGVVTNDLLLKTDHEALGFVYKTVQTDKRFNDSECVGIEVARFIEGQTDKVGIQGSCAFIALQIDKKTNVVEKLFFGRNTNPLKMAKTRSKLFLSSEGKGDDIIAYKLYSCKLDAEMKLESKAMPFATVAAYKPYVPLYSVGNNNNLLPAKPATVVHSGYNDDDDDDDDARYSHYYSGHASNNLDLPPDDIDELEEKINNACEIDTESIDDALASFYGLLSNRTECEAISTSDIDSVVRVIKDSLTMMMFNCQSIHEKELIKEYETNLTS
jgi:glucosamine 6-phosphate synthetase-like amidotransferase/phosphosugar isomerase protein